MQYMYKKFQQVTNRMFRETIDLGLLQNCCVCENREI